MKNLPALCKQHGYLLIAAAIGAIICWKMLPRNPENKEITKTHAAPLPKPKWSDHRHDALDASRHELLIAMGLTKVQDISSRVASIKGLPQDLNQQELDALLRFLTEYRLASIPEGAHAHLFHELCNKLHHFTDSRPLFASTLYHVARDTRHDATTRDYALQHLRRIWQKSKSDPNLRESIQASFWQLAETEPAVSASALLSLHNLGVATSPTADYSQAPIGSTLFQPFLDKILQQPPSADTLSQRMTAIRIIGERKIHSSHSHLLAIIENPSEHILARTTAINALGKLGMKKQLTTLAANYNTEPRLAAAFTHALR